LVQHDLSLLNGLSLVRQAQNELFDFRKKMQILQKHDCNTKYNSATLKTVAIP